MQAVSTALEAERSKVATLRQSGAVAGAAGSKRDEIQIMRKQTDVALEQVLDDPQYVAYETMRRRAAQRARARLVAPAP